MKEEKNSRNLHKGGPKDPKLRAERRKEVKDWMESIGPFSIPVKTFAEKYGVTTDTIYDDRDYWLSKMDFSDVDKFGKKIILGLNKNFSIIEEMKNSKDQRIRLQAISVGNQTSDVFTKMLENYGFKEKVQDKLGVEHKFDEAWTVQLIGTPVEEIRNEKRKNKKVKETESHS